MRPWARPLHGKLEHQEAVLQVLLLQGPPLCRWKQRHPCRSTTAPEVKLGCVRTTAPEAQRPEAWLCAQSLRIGCRKAQRPANNVYRHAEIIINHGRHASDLSTQIHGELHTSQLGCGRILRLPLSTVRAD